jgi:phage tail-like protein
MATIKLFATNVVSKMHLLYGVIELNWSNPTHTGFDHVFVLRKINDFATDPLDPYATLVYEGKAERIYDYSESLKAEESIAPIIPKVIGTYDSIRQVYKGQIEDSLNPDMLYYYTIFTVDTEGNIYHSNATRTTGRANKKQDFSRLLYDKLPAIYKVEDKQTQLKRYLEVMGFAFDFIKTKIDNVSTFIDIDTCEPYQLDYIANLLDWELDKSLPIPSQRQSLKNAIEVYRKAGTKHGLDLLVKTNSGFPNSSGVMESRGFNLTTTFFGYYPFELLRYHEEGTPDFRPVEEGGDDFELIGKGGDPLKYTWDFSPDARQEEEKFIAYVRKTTPISAEQQEQMVKRLNKLLNRFSPAGTKYDIEVY